MAWEESSANKLKNPALFVSTWINGFPTNEECSEQKWRAFESFSKLIELSLHNAGLESQWMNLWTFSLRYAYATTSYKNENYLDPKAIVPFRYTSRANIDFLSPPTTFIIQHNIENVDRVNFTGMP